MKYIKLIGLMWKTIKEAEQKNARRRKRFDQHRRMLYKKKQKKRL